MINDDDDDDDDYYYYYCLYCGDLHVVFWVPRDIGSLKHKLNAEQVRSDLISLGLFNLGYLLCYKLINYF